MKVMQKLNEIHPTLPAKDVDRAIRWYSEHFGIQPTQRRPEGTMFEIGDSRLFIYPSQFAGTNQATAAGITVDDVRGAVDGLRETGITFDEFDMPGVTWEDGVATMTMDGHTSHGAWFRDSEGNIIALSEFA